MKKLLLIAAALPLSTYCAFSGDKDPAAKIGDGKGQIVITWGEVGAMVDQAMQDPSLKGVSPTEVRNYSLSQMVQMARIAFYAEKQKFNHNEKTKKLMESAAMNALASAYMTSRMGDVINEKQIKEEAAKYLNAKHRKQFNVQYVAFKTKEEAEKFISSIGKDDPKKVFAQANNGKGATKLPPILHDGHYVAQHIKSLWTAIANTKPDTVSSPVAMGGAYIVFIHSEEAAAKETVERSMAEFKVTEFADKFQKELDGSVPVFRYDENGTPLKSSEAGEKKGDKKDSNPAASATK